MSWSLTSLLSFDREFLGYCSVLEGKGNLAVLLPFTLVQMQWNIHFLKYLPYP